MKPLAPRSPFLPISRSPILPLLFASTLLLAPPAAHAAFGPVVATAPAVHDDRTAVPSDDKQAEALKTIRDIYKDEYAKKSADDRRLLATKLLDEGRKAQGDPANQYVLFREARDTASLAGDVDQAIAAAKEMGDAFAIDAFENINKTLTTLRPILKTPDVQMQGYAAAVANAVAAADKEQFDAASHAADLAAQFATAAKSMTKATEAHGLATAITAQAKAFDDYKTGLETLKKSNNQIALAGANQDVGLYTALYHKEWTDGLKMIVKGQDADWSPPAGLDAKNPSSSVDMLAVADAWYDLSNKQPGHRYCLQERAEYWYNLALPDAEGIAKTKIEKRLETLAAAKPTYLGGTDDATKSVLPTTLDLAKLKDVLRLYQAGDQSKRTDVQHQFMALESRLHQDLMNAPTADFMARLVADISLRKLMESSGAGDIATANPDQPIYNKMGDFIVASKSKEDLAARLLGFEKIYADQMTDNAFKNKFDGTIYAALRTYADQNQNTYNTNPTKAALADYLKSKNIKSSAIDRFKTFVAHQPAQLGAPPAPAPTKPKPGG